MVFTPQITSDGSCTFFSPDFQENFHSHYGAKQEAELKFVKSCQLHQQAQTQTPLHLLDICYGLGYNSAAALSAIWSVNPQCQVKLIALELNPLVPKTAAELGLLQIWDDPIPQLLQKLAQFHHLQTPQLEGKLLIGDGRQTIQEVLQQGFCADAIFLDPFSPPKCPQLWTVEFLGLVAKCLQPRGYLATYSCASSVRRALQLAGLHIGASAGVGRRSPGTIARFIPENLPPLSLQEQEHLQTRAAIPYRDPFLEASADLILQRREQEQKDSDLEPTSHWKKRWR